MAESLEQILAGEGVDMALMKRIATLFEGYPSADVMCVCITIAASVISMHLDDKEKAIENASGLLRALALAKAKEH